MCPLCSRARCVVSVAGRDSTVHAREVVDKEANTAKLVGELRPVEVQLDTVVLHVGDRTGFPGSGNVGSVSRSSTNGPTPHVKYAGDLNHSATIGNNDLVGEDVLPSIKATQHATLDNGAPLATSGGSEGAQLIVFQRYHRADLMIDDRPLHVPMF